MQHFPVHARAALAHAAEAQVTLDDVSKLFPRCTDDACYYISHVTQGARAMFDAALDKALDLVPDDQIEAALAFLQECVDALAQQQAINALRGARIQADLKAKRERKEREEAQRRDAKKKKHLSLV